MKTAEHYLMRWRDNEFELHELIELAQKEAFKEGQYSPKIKQLEWEELSREVIEADYEYPPKSVFKAATPFMYYTIHKSFTNTFEVNGDPEIYSSIKEAKAASQRDFEKRIKECLE